MYGGKSVRRAAATVTHGVFRRPGTRVHGRFSTVWSRTSEGQRCTAGVQQVYSVGAGSGTPRVGGQNGQFWPARPELARTCQGPFYVLRRCSGDHHRCTLSRPSKGRGRPVVSYTFGVRRPRSGWCLAATCCSPLADGQGYHSRLCHQTAPTRRAQTVATDGSVATWPGRTVTLV